MKSQVLHTVYVIFLVRLQEEFDIDPSQETTPWGSKIEIYSSMVVIFTLPWSKWFQGFEFGVILTPYWS